MVAHAITIDLVNTIGGPRTQWYRWRCSCGSLGPNAVNARIARRGAIRHIAAMERGKR